MKVLIVDDEAVIRMGLKSCLEKISAVQCDVRVAGNGREALEILEGFGADLMITDITMPQMSGLELIAEAQKRGFCRRYVILSGYGEFEYARQALRFGVCDYLLKPVNREELNRAVTAAAHSAGRQQDLSLLKPYSRYFSHAEQEETPYSLRKIVRYIREHFSQNISLAALAKISGRSENYICGQFKKEMDISYMDLVNELRLREALYLLLYEPALSVREIAGKVGYATERQLFRLVRGRLDMTPLQVRESAGLPAAIS